MSDGEEWKGEEEKPPLYGISWGYSLTPATPEQLAAAEAQQARDRAEAELRSTFVVRFNPTTACVKCGHTDNKTRHCAAQTSYMHSDCFKHTAGKDHFHRICKQCKYVWYEWPLDHEDSR